MVLFRWTLRIPTTLSAAFRWASYHTPGERRTLKTNCFHPPRHPSLAHSLSLSPSLLLSLPFTLFLLFSVSLLSSSSLSLFPSLSVIALSPLSRVLSVYLSLATPHTLSVSLPRSTPLCLSLPCPWPLSCAGPLEEHKEGLCEETMQLLRCD